MRLNNFLWLEDACLSERQGRLKIWCTLMILFLAVPLVAQNSEIYWSAFGSGFGISTSTTSGTMSSAGQSFAGISTNGNSKVISGFLAYSSTIVTDVSDEQEIIPTVYKLNQNYPNPFNPNTIISWQLPVSGHVLIKIYDILGSEVATIVNEEKTAGRYEVNFNANSLASGIYIYKIQAGSFINSKKMILLK